MHDPNLASKTVRLCLPCSPKRLLTAPDRCSGSFRTRRLRRSRRLETAFHSPRAAVRFRTTSPRSQLLACSFSATPNSASGPFGLELPSSLFGFPQRGRSSLKTRCRRFLRRSRWLSEPCSSLGSFDPSGSSLDPVHLWKLTSAKRPISVTPRRRKFVRLGSGSSLQTRLRPAWLAVP